MADLLPTSIGTLIRDARKQRGLTQQELADVLGTSQSAVHRIESGGQNLSLSIEPGETATFEIDVKDSGTYAFYCTEFCSALHLEMMGYMFVADQAK